jgi:hypothetical protein
MSKEVGDYFLPELLVLGVAASQSHVSVLPGSDQVKKTSYLFDPVSS